MPTCSRPVGSMPCRMPALVVETSVDPSSSNKSAYLGICASRGSNSTNADVRNGNQTKHTNDCTPQQPEAPVGSAEPKSNRVLWISKAPVIDQERMAASTAETTAGPSSYAQRSSSRKCGKVEQLSRAANKEWLYSLRTKLDNLLGGASGLKKPQTLPPFSFKIRTSAKTLLKPDEPAIAGRPHGKGFFFPVRVATKEQQQTEQEVQRQYYVPQQPAQQQVTVKHWFEHIEGRSPVRSSGETQVMSRSARVQAASEQGIRDASAHKEEVGVSLRLTKPGRLPPLPLLEVAAARFGLDNQLRAQKPFLGMEENDVVFQNLLNNYYTLKLSPFPQEVSLKLVMLSPHLAVFLGPENKPLLRLSALTNAKIFLIGASIEDSQRNTRYFSDRSNPIYCPSSDSESDKLRLAELRGNIDAVLAAYAHIAYRLQHPWKRAVAYCVHEAITAGQKATRERRICWGANEVEVDKSIKISGAAAGLTVSAVIGSVGANGVSAIIADSERAHSYVHGDSCDTRDVFISADGNGDIHWSARNLELVKRLLDMPPVMCEAPQIVHGVAVENAPVKPLCIPQIARDDVWVLPLP